MSRYVPREAIALMFDTAPRDWWRFVPCPTCHAGRQHPCLMGGASWPKPARYPHARRREIADVMHATLWLLRDFPRDVLGDE